MSELDVNYAIGLNSGLCIGNSSLYLKDKEIERLNKENNDLRKLYQRTYKHLFDIGNDELARYFQAQIDECSTFYIEPIIDYYEEYKRLNNIINNIKKRVLDEGKPLPSAKEIIDIVGVDKE